MEDFTEPMQRLPLPQRSSGETRAATRHAHFHLGAHSPCTAHAVRASRRGAARSAARSYCQVISLPCRRELFNAFKRDWQACQRAMMFLDELEHVGFVAAGMD